MSTADLVPVEGTIEPRVNTPRVSEGDIYNALVEADGNKSAAARALDMRREVLQERIDRSPTLASLMQDLNEDIIDEAESNHRKRVRSGQDPTAERFILQTLGKGRGYTTGVSGSGKDGDIVITVRKFGEPDGQ